MVLFHDLLHLRLHAPGLVFAQGAEIALGDGELFVSEYGNGNIVAYDLSTNGKVGTYLDEIQTTASAIMGLEIGPNGHLYYVDHDQNEVVRIDPFMDEDGDGVEEARRVRCVLSSIW